MQNLFFFITETFCVPRPQIKATCNHPLVLLRRPNDKATETRNHMIEIANVTYCNYMHSAHNSLRLFYQNKNTTFGSKNTIGFGSRMQDNNNPFASFGLRGITTYTRNTLEAFAENELISKISKINVINKPN